MLFRTSRQTNSYHERVRAKGEEKWKSITEIRFDLRNVDGAKSDLTFQLKMKQLALLLRKKVKKKNKMKIKALFGIEFC